jgi:acetamidase/formamidase
VVCTDSVYSSCLRLLRLLLDSVGTAIETPIKATLRFTIIKNKPYVKTLHFKTPPVHTTESEEYYCTTGIEPSTFLPFDDVLWLTSPAMSRVGLEEATRSATRHMIEFLMAEKGLDRVESYMLCSVVGDLRLHEVVSCPFISSRPEKSVLTAGLASRIRLICLTML